MIYTYGITQQGTYHVKHGLICQDAHNIIKCDESYVIAAVADGLGSEEHSDIASQMAAKISTEYCAENIKDDCSDEQIMEIIRDSFALAQSRIEKVATDNGHDLDQYDTTLSLAVFRGNALYYGQSGDSGIVTLTAEGLYKKVVEQQRDEEGRVFPLYFGEDKWVFGKFPEPVVSVFLATDGMLETLFPVYIRNEPVNIYVALARYFMGPDSLHIEESGEDYVKEKVSEFMDSIPDAQVNDDKTVVVMVNPDFEMKIQEPDYYAEPNWEELRRRYEEAWKRAAYPHLFKDAENDQEEIKNNMEANGGAGDEEDNDNSCSSVTRKSAGNEGALSDETQDLKKVPCEGFINDEEQKGKTQIKYGAKLDKGKGVFKKLFSKSENSPDTE
ncbi:protein phosphatase 2C domain-containing protein [Catonella massiliensis]|uniref:Protein phosphatase 2C domain-containing protein n=1 Tax=Catonella massiliensis TaxID=2799636 RepID=A0ABS1J0W4_9FIRM|nr:protein phosphatase 2C domain-containing protein [Catonella massiliensis]MBK5897786.1 protein phosphatase 2C domain-containing protein [Catonella massiliensis]